MTKKDKRPELSVKEIKFIKGIVAGKSKRQAAYDVTKTRSYNAAAVQATRMLKKDSVKSALQEALVKAGITVDDVVKPVKEGLTAERVAIVGNGDEAMAEVQPDFNIRLRSAQLAAKWMGAEDKEEGSGNVINFNFNADAEKKRKYVSNED